MGLIGALSIVWIKEDIEDKWINTEEMAEVTNQKILGVIPWVNSSKLFFNDFIQPPNSILGIAYNNIATNLNSRSYVEEAQSLAFISTVHTRDKSSVIPNLAAALARSEKTVTLIDTDFTSPSKLLNVLNINATNSKDIIDIINEINKHLRLHNTIEHKDLNDIISQALIPINITTENGKDIIFYYLCANKKANTIYDYVASRGFKMIVDFLKHYNEFVLIDTPTKPVVYPEIPAISSITERFDPHIRDGNKQGGVGKFNQKTGKI
ncbi:MAG: hypothetical protein MZU84_03730 [Sphingobacterium sp.]|nr:hypothetical protein [Sphingobacterium sp.]